MGGLEVLYGIYLWHWPVFMVTRPGIDLALQGWPLLAVRLAVTVVLADLSYRVIEPPIRRGALGRLWRELKESGGRRRRVLQLGWSGCLAGIVLLCTGLAFEMADAEKPQRPEYLAQREVQTGDEVKRYPDR